MPEDGRVKIFAERSLLADAIVRVIAMSAEIQMVMRGMGGIRAGSEDRCEVAASRQA